MLEIFARFQALNASREAHSEMTFKAEVQASWILTVVPKWHPFIGLLRRPKKKKNKVWESDARTIRRLENRWNVLQPDHEEDDVGWGAVGMQFPVVCDVSEFADRFSRPRKKCFLGFLISVPLNKHPFDGLRSKVLLHSSHCRRWSLARLSSAL